MVKDIDYYVGMDANDLTDEELEWTLNKIYEFSFKDEDLLNEYVKLKMNDIRSFKDSEYVTLHKLGNMYYWHIDD